MSKWNLASSAKTAVEAGSGSELVEEFGALTSAGIDRALQTPKAKTPMEGQRYYEMKNVTENNYVTQGMAGIGLMQANSDAEVMPIDKQSMGFQNTISNYVLRLSMAIERELLETTRYKGVIGQHARLLVDSSKRTMEIIMADGYNRAFGTTALAFLCEDGLGLFSASRPQPKAGVAAWSNLETAGALTVDTIATARLNLKKYLNANGDLSPQMLSKVIVSPDLEDTMMKIAKTTLDVGTNLNDVNVVSGTSYEVWNWLDDDTIIYQGDKNEGFPEFHIRKNASITTFNDGNPDLLKTRVRAAVGNGCQRPGGIRGQLTA